MTEDEEREFHRTNAVSRVAAQANVAGYEQAKLDEVGFEAIRLGATWAEVAEAMGAKSGI